MPAACVWVLLTVNPEILRSLEDTGLVILGYVVDSYKSYLTVKFLVQRQENEVINKRR